MRTVEQSGDQVNVQLVLMVLGCWTLLIGIARVGVGWRLPEAAGQCSRTRAITVVEIEARLRAELRAAGGGSAALPLTRGNDG